MFTDNDMIPISALQHWAFCQRQCALIHLDQAWAENARTASGRILHERTHDGGAEWRDNAKLVRSLPLRSVQLGLIGVADVVEFHPPGPETPPDQQTKVAGLTGLWSVFPVEFKRGKAKKNDCDRIQLCAQAICLEEMLNVSIPAGSLYYGKTKRRVGVLLDERLRALTAETTKQVRQMFRQLALPPSAYSKKCRSCSLIETCMPERISRSGPIASNYLKRMINASLAGNTSEKSNEDT